MKNRVRKVLNAIGFGRIVEKVRRGIPDLFDDQWYSETYLTAKVSRREAFTHYQSEGWMKGHLPTPLFNPRWYLDKNPDVAIADIDPFMHYYHQGWREGRQPNEWFDPTWYLDRYPEVLEKNIDPLTYYLVTGRKAGHQPSMEFGEDEYLAIVPEAKSSRFGPFAHYVHFQRPALRIDRTDGLLTDAPEAGNDTVTDLDGEISNDHLTDQIQGGKFIIIHIGFPKTATSSIQLGLWKNRELLQKLGLYYPESGVISGGHHNISYQLRGKNQFQPKFGGMKELVREINGAEEQAIILSSEDLAGISPMKLLKLRIALGESKVNIIAYLRRQDEFLQSFWAQLVKTGYLSESFADWLDSRLVKDHPYLGVIGGDYYQVLENWAGVFGRENILVRPFERSQIEGDIFHEFLHICGVPEPKIFELPGIKNVTPSIKTIEVIRKYIDELSYLSKIDLSREYLEDEGRKLAITSLIAEAILDYSHVHGWNDQKINFLTEEKHHKIMDFFAESNRKVSENYLDGHILFQEPFKHKALSMESYNLSEMGSEEMLALNAYILRRIFG